MAPADWHRRVGPALVALVFSMPCASAAEAVAVGDDAYGAYELNQGGIPFANGSFGRGWPTDERARDLTDFACESGVELTVGLLGGAGPSIASSAYQNARGTSWSRDLELCATLSGFEGSPRGLEVAFLPLRHALPELRSSYDPDRAATWCWKGGGGEHALDALGFALMAESELALEQLSIKRPDGGLGRTPREGFVALVALHSACAKVYALRHQLHYDADAKAISPQAELSALPTRQFRLPTAWTSEVAAGRLSYTVAGQGDDVRSRLGAQAAVLLGLSRLAALCGPSAPARLQGLFNEQKVAGKEVVAFPADLPVAVMETALFVFRSIRSLHVTVSGSGGAASTADENGPGRTVTPTDLGLFLMALEGFAKHVEAPSRWRSTGKGLETALEEELKKARRLVAPLSAMIRTWQLNEPGFYDAYDVGSSSRVVRDRSLASQGFAIRGLLAAHRTLSPNDPNSELLKAAREALRWLDAAMWDEDAQAYVEKDGKGRRAPAVGAIAVLGALRDMALLTGEGSYLLRYRQHLANLRDGGLVREASGLDAPSLSPAIDFGPARKR